MKLDKILTSLTELEKLKTIERGLNVGNRKESSAEHSWSCLLIADVLFDSVKEPLDRLKVFEYLIYHDVVEVYAGDAKFNNPEEMRVKQEKEEKAVKKIIAMLPNSERFQRILSEYESRKTRESEFAKAIDCIDACIRNLNDEHASNQDGFTESLIRQKYEPHVSKFPITKALFETLMEKLVALNKI